MAILALQWSWTPDFTVGCLASPSLASSQPLTSGHGPWSAGQCQKPHMATINAWPATRRPAAYDRIITQNITINSVHRANQHTAWLTVRHSQTSSPAPCPSKDSSVVKSEGSEC
ncbi:hypothetical protein DPEC_G00161150 [Dallia pectoralis]|uniref:Uncharacterized protein n=1 Tax=Dallia pectoralis TaxID=75939 RepID=A0ACC2GGJ3_DALPE|nr:hypothetical protein DPEC_G00161150 [Dallia pectoralis]